MKSVLTDLYICSIFYRFNLKSIANVSSIDLKKEEPILKELADTYLRSPFKTYPAEVLDKVPVPHPSSTVKKATGSGSVAEAFFTVEEGWGTEIGRDTSELQSR